MYKIEFYKNRRGIYEVYEYIKELRAKTDKDSRIKSHKISDYLGTLEANGLSSGEPYIKPIEGTKNLWELRPLRDRIFFVTWENDTFVLLHHFQKTTQKTPRREIEQALREIEDLKERGLQ